MYEEMLGVVEEVLGGRVLGVVVFGSSVYMGCGRDIDVLVVVDGGLEPREKLRLEAELARRLRARPGCLAFDVHVLGMEDFRANLEPGSFLLGLALGYEVLLDRVGVEDEILGFLERLAGERYILHNEYGSWNLGHHARITPALRRRRRPRSG